MELLKKYWKKVVVILLVLFSMTTCMKNCSKSNELRKVNKQIDSISDVIMYQKHLIDSLEFEIKMITKEKDIYKSTSDSYKSSLDKATSKKTAITVNVPKEDKKE
jgi:sugar-specific transcriptional regulator TrmB